jgi:TetR/AcrR family transcriptional regulator
MSHPVRSAQVVPSPRVREKRQRRRREILHAALRAFRERGYHETTLAGIAAQLGIRSTALYHYFPDKESILHACHREALEEVEGILRQALLRFPSAPDRLRFVISEHVRVMTDTLEGSPLALETSSLAPAHAEEIIGRRDRYESAVRAIIEQGVATGQCRPVNSKIATFAIFGAINWIARWYRPDGSLGPAELGSQFADYLTGGLTCR